MLRDPLPEARISQGFSDAHTAVDLASPVQGEYEAFIGNPVYAADGGYVKIPAYMTEGYGNWVIVQKANHWVPSYADHERYAHLQDIVVVPGQAIKPGDQVGTVGYSGRTDPPGPPGTHLHFEVWRGGVRIDPMEWLRKGGAFMAEIGDALHDMVIRWSDPGVQAQKNLYWMEVMRRKREEATALLNEASQMEMAFVDPNGPLVWQLHLMGLPTPDGFDPNLILA